MKKLLVFFLTVFGALLFSSISAKAITLVEVSRDDSQVVYDVVSSEPADTVALQLRLEVVKGKILSFEKTDNGEFLVIATCKNSDGTKDYFSIGQVCADYAKTGGVIEEETLLGSLVVKPDTLLQKGSENGYLLETNEFVAETSQIEGMEIPEEVSEASDLATTDEPEEEKESRKMLYIVLIAILGATTVGLVLVDQARNKQEGDKKEQA